MENKDEVIVEENSSEVVVNGEVVSDKKEVKIIKTDEGSKDGQNKCPKCGATDISLSPKTGKLRCNFCRHQFEPVKLDFMETDISKLKGEIIGSGASNIEADTKDIITLKCTSCGAEVVVDTSSSTSARCHWCRNTLSINEQIPNGAVPDTVLPFQVEKKDAKEEIEKFVGKRKFYAHPVFRREFTTDNIMGVYLPYMIVDANTHASLSGQGEHEVRRYTVKNGDRTDTYYDADLYDVKREFDLTIEGLTVESSKDKLDNSSNKTNNIINAIMPFDTENCVKWDANYIKGYTSEKRDTNIDELKGLVYEQSKDVVRHACNSTLDHYDRGVRWDSENLEIIGQQWKSAYLPVWLYSYQEKKKNGKDLLHYVAVNARTKETMGSVPIHMPKLFIISFLVELLGLFAMLFTYSDDNNWPLLFLLSGFIYFGVIYSKYRNTGARHTHESDTKTNMTGLSEYDQLVEHRKRLSNSSMNGANNKSVNGSSVNNVDILKIVKGTINK